MSNRPAPRQRSDFRRFVTITTRWMDNDVYRHINNVHYYSFFDTAVNGHLVESGLLDINESQTVGLVVETQCNYFSSAAFPANIEAGLKVAHLGRSSVRYEIGLFVEGSRDAIAQGHFVHVYVDRATQRPVEIPENFRSALVELT